MADHLQRHIIATATPTRVTFDSTLEGGFVLIDELESEVFSTEPEAAEVEREVIMEPQAKKLVRHQIYSWSTTKRRLSKAPRIIRISRPRPGDEVERGQNEFRTSYLRLYGGAADAGNGNDSFAAPHTFDASQPTRSHEGLKKVPQKLHGSFRVHTTTISNEENRLSDPNFR